MENIETMYWSDRKNILKVLLFFFFLGKHLGLKKFSFICVYKYKKLRLYKIFYLYDITCGLTLDLVMAGPSVQLDPLGLGKKKGDLGLK